MAPPLSATPSPQQVRVESLAQGGEAVGRLPDGQVVFVPGGAPGDRLEIVVTEGRKGYARARLLRVLDAGPARVAAPCPLAAGRCGGCPWMHVSRPAQLHEKSQGVRRALRHSLDGAQLLPILAPAPDLGYRLRARLVCRGGRFGYQAARSHQLSEVRRCPVLVPALESALLLAAARLGPLCGDGASLSGIVGGGAVHLALRTGGRGRGPATAVLRGLLADGAIAGALIDGEPLGAAGVPLSEDEGDTALRGSADGFAQASAAGHELLPRLVAAAALAPVDGEAPRQLLELYAGSGNLTRALLPGAAVLAVEGDAGAARRLESLGAAGLRVLAAPVEAVLGRLRREGRRFDGVVLDPPRAGLGSAWDDLAALGAPRLVYVSCDPMTLGRDVERLGHRGYALRWAQPIDLMPHTAHVEVVALLERRAAATSS